MNKKYPNLTHIVKKSTMKLFLISQTKNYEFETCKSAVVAAESADVARAMDPDTGDAITPNGKCQWHWVIDPSDVEVQYLGEAADGIPHGVILAEWIHG